MGRNAFTRGGQKRGELILDCVPDSLKKRESPLPLKKRKKVKNDCAWQGGDTAPRKTKGERTRKTPGSFPYLTNTQERNQKGFTKVTDPNE